MAGGLYLTWQAVLADGEGPSKSSTAALNPQFLLLSLAVPLEGQQLMSAATVVCKKNCSCHWQDHSISINRIGVCGGTAMLAPHLLCFFQCCEGHTMVRCFMSCCTVGWHCNNILKAAQESREVMLQSSCSAACATASGCHHITNY